jgi:hypothetical protein
VIDAKIRVFQQYRFKAEAPRGAEIKIFGTALLGLNLGTFERPLPTALFVAKDQT